MSEYDVIIAGAGPGGIASAVECKKMGIDKVLLLEKTYNIASTIREYYKAGKRVDKDYKGQAVDLKGNIAFSDGNKEGTLELFDSLLKENSVEIAFNSEVDNVAKDTNGFIIRCANNTTYKAKFVILAIGKMGKPNKPSYPLPISLRKKINFNVNDCVKGEHILVIGGGNSAVEYAIYLTTIANTTLNYRRKEFTRINDENAKGLNDSLKSGLNPKFGVDIVSVVDEASKLKVTFSDNSSMLFDRIVYAIGGVAPVDFLKKCGVDVDSHGCAICSDIKESNIKNVFVIGDILFKNGGSIAICMNDAHTAISAIKARL